MNNIIADCYGICDPDNIGAWGVILSYNKSEKKFYGVQENTNIDTMKLYAIIQALIKIKNKKISTKVSVNDDKIVENICQWREGIKIVKEQAINFQGLWVWLLDLILQFKNIEFEKIDNNCEETANIYKLCNNAITYYSKEKID